MWDLPDTPLQKLVMGDSMIRGVKKWKRATISCHGGERISGLIARLTRLGDWLSWFHVMTFLIATNDIGDHTPFRLIKSRFRSLKDKIRSINGQGVIVFISILPRPCDANSDIVDSVNSWLKDWCRQPGMLFLDARYLFIQDGKINCQCYNRGKLHLNRQGEKAFSRFLMNRLGDKNLRMLVRSKGRSR